MYSGKRETLTSHSPNPDAKHRSSWSAWLDHPQQGLLGGVIPPRRAHGNSHPTSLDLAAHVLSSAVFATENEPFGEQTGTGRMKQSLRIRKVATLEKGCHQ